MNPNQTPVLDARDAGLVVAELTALQPAYTPELLTNTPGPVWALAQIFGKYVQAIVERLNQAPDKNKLAFLDLMGVNLLPAQAARAPLVFKAIMGTGDGRIPVHTRAGAKIPGSPNPLVFETEQAIALAAAPLVEVVSVMPSRDSVAKHSAHLAHGDAFRLFDPEEPILHQLYIAHSTCLALAGASTVHVQFDLETPGSEALPILWEFWNGHVWQGFDALSPSDDPAFSFDGTAGLTRSGVVRLINPSGTAAKTVIRGLDTYWIRGTLTAPLPPNPSRTAALAERIRVSCEISRPLRFGVIRTEKTDNGDVKIYGAVGDIQPDEAYSQGAKVDVSQAFFPLGKSPDQNSAFYFRSDEVFSKAGAKVTVSFRHALTPEQQADQLAAEQLADKARDAIMAAARGFGKVLQGLGNRVLPLIPPSNDLTTYAIALAGLHSAMAGVKKPADLAALASAIHDFSEVMSQLDSGFEVEWDYFYYAINDAAAEVDGILKSLDDLAKVVTAGNLPLVVSAMRSAAQYIATMGIGMWSASWGPWNFAFSDLESNVLVLQPIILAFSDPPTQFDLLKDSVDKVVTDLGDVAAIYDVNVAALFGIVAQVAGLVDTAVPLLVKIAGEKGFGTVDADAPKLDPPKLVWEYWGGGGWERLVGPSDSGVQNFLQSGSVTFNVPGGMRATSVQASEGFWMRVRIDSGSYQTMRIMTWKDQGTNNVNTIAVLEQRPPAIEGFYIGYEYKSPRSTPQHTVTFNDFQYEDRTAEARGPGMAFAPYSATSDRTPTLYLGFDGALPADLLGLYFSAPEPREEPAPVAVKWEGFDGSSWTALTVNDETGGLVMPGMVSAVWPGAPAPPSALVTQGQDNRATVTDPRQAARFKAGQQFYIAQNGAGELVTLASVAHDVLTFTAPLSRAYSNATIQLAVMPRFGTPRSWIRVRLQQDIDPPHTRVLGIYANAVWASQMQTNQNETLGSSSSEPDQTYMIRQTPVLEDEVIEVRELEGPRAAVELPMLREDLARRGMSDANLRVVTDPRTGQITQVWVRWRVKPNLLFSGPDDREATLERTRGKLSMGDGVHGRIPPAGQDNIRVSEYRSGGGVIGNVAAGAISQLLSGVTAESVTNPRVAEAGADGETIAQVLERGPWVMRHRLQSVARLDYEQMARQASPGVAVARAYPAVRPNGLPAPGWVTLIIVPQSSEPRPQPTFDLRKRVHRYIAARAPAALEHLAVIGPAYVPVGVSIAVTPRNPSEAGPVGTRVREALAAFLHPLTGGPGGAGWPFGRSVYLSDIASLVESIEGVDYAGSIDLLIEDTPVGDIARIAENRMVAAGTLRVILGGIEV